MLLSASLCEETETHTAPPDETTYVTGNLLMFVCNFHSITRLLISSKVRRKKACCTQSSASLFTLQIKRQRRYNDSLRPNTSGAPLELTARPGLGSLYTVGKHSLLAAAGAREGH